MLCNKRRRDESKKYEMVVIPRGILFLLNSEFRTILSFVLDYTLEATKAFRAFISTENWCSSRVLIYKQHRPRCSWYTFERKSVCGVQRRHGVSGIPDKFKESLQSPRGQVCVYTRYIFISSYCAASNIFHFEATLKFHVQSLFFVYSCSKVTECLSSQELATFSTLEK